MRARFFGGEIVALLGGPMHGAGTVVSPGNLCALRPLDDDGEFYHRVSETAWNGFPQMATAAEIDRRGLTPEFR